MFVGTRGGLSQTARATAQIRELIEREDRCYGKPPPVELPSGTGRLFSRQLPPKEDPPAAGMDRDEFWGVDEGPLQLFHPDGPCGYTDDWGSAEWVERRKKLMASYSQGNGNMVPAAMVTHLQLFGEPEDDEARRKREQQYRPGLRPLRTIWKPGEGPAAAHESSPFDGIELRSRRTRPQRRRPFWLLPRWQLLEKRDLHRRKHAQRQRSARKGKVPWPQGCAAVAVSRHPPPDQLEWRFQQAAERRAVHSPRRRAGSPSNAVLPSVDLVGRAEDHIRSKLQAERNLLERGAHPVPRLNLAARVIAPLAPAPHIRLCGQHTHVSRMKRKAPVRPQTARPVPPSLQQGQQQQQQQQQPQPPQQPRPHDGSAWPRAGETTGSTPAMASSPRRGGSGLNDILWGQPTTVGNRDAAADPLGAPSRRPGADAAPAFTPGVAVDGHPYSPHLPRRPATARAPTAGRPHHEVHRRIGELWRRFCADGDGPAESPPATAEH
eukprot:TRINITY_DN14735_c0_g1_i2.p2 TRINITY_DN14735_c0_g1~~TRINITY_DN14735_c0_g1_i2.p2  ORF type:complete len:493 (+),score=110.54 TRINITY_DN14735_c0_g1_i2:81-1559(+)